MTTVTRILLAVAHAGETAIIFTALEKTSLSSNKMSPDFWKMLLRMQKGSLTAKERCFQRGPIFRSFSAYKGTGCDASGVPKKFEF
jgi:hypothetical protein